LTNSFCCDKVDISQGFSKLAMKFTLKKETKRKSPIFASQQLMAKQVRKVLSGNDQGLILMVRA